MAEQFTQEEARIKQLQDQNATIRAQILALERQIAQLDIAISTTPINIYVTVGTNKESYQEARPNPEYQALLSQRGVLESQRNALMIQTDANLNEITILLHKIKIGAEAFAKLREELDLKLTIIRDDYQRRDEEIRREASAAVDTARLEAAREVQLAREEADEKILAAREEADMKIQAVRQEKALQFTSLVGQVNQALGLTDIGQQISMETILPATSEEIERITQQTANKIAGFRQQADEKIADTIAEADAKIERIEKETTDKLEQFKKDTDAKIEAIKTEYEAKITGQELKIKELTILVIILGAAYLAAKKISKIRKPKTLASPEEITV